MSNPITTGPETCKTHHQEYVDGKQAQTKMFNMTRAMQIAHLSE